MSMSLNSLEELIKSGLEYIGMPFSENEDINIELLFNIRKFVFDKSNEWYQIKFSDAYNFDIGVDRKKDDTYYSDDGIKYFFNDNMELESYTLYDSNERIDLSSPVKCKWTFHYDKQGGKEHFFYNYINEVDHFFTYCINKYLTSKDKDEVCCFEKVRDRGLIYIKKEIEEWSKRGEEIISA